MRGHFHTCTAKVALFCHGLIDCTRPACDPNEPDVCKPCLAVLAARARTVKASP